MTRDRPLTRLAFAPLGDPPSPARGEGKKCAHGDAVPDFKGKVA
jgi:hypothetical protein